MKIQSIGAFEAKTRLSELLEKVQRGQVFCITKRGRPVAELRTPARLDFGVVSARTATLSRRFAALRAKVKSGPSARELISLGREQ